METAVAFILLSLFGQQADAAGSSAWLMRLRAVGFCGEFTTFSAFSAETVHLLRDGRYGPATLYAGLSVGVCTACAALGMWLGELTRN